MELKLQFNEDAVREIHNIHFDEKEKLQRQNTRRGLRTASLFLFLATLSLLLVNNNQSWIVGTVIFGVISIMILLVVHNDKLMGKKEISQQKEKSNAWVTRYTKINEISYIFQGEKIQYFEEGVLLKDLNSSAIKEIQFDDQNVFLVFEKKEDSIWIPKFTTNDLDFEKVQLIAKKLSENL